MRKDVLSEKIVNIAPSGIRKFFDIVSEMPEAISLGVGEPDFDTPWKVREEAIYSLERRHTYYTSNAGLAELRQIICEYSKKKYDLDYDMKECVVTIGGSEAIDIACRAIINPGDEIVIVQPCFVSYAPCVILAGGTPVYLNLSADTEFKLTAEALDTVVTEKTKAIIMCYPNNPTGAIMTKEELAPIADYVKEKDLLVITDEIYAELTYGSGHASIAACPDMKERCIVVNGFSKAFAMTGWRLGYALAPQNIMKQMIKIHQFAIMAAPTISQYAAIQAMTDCEKEVEDMRTAYNQRRRFLLKAFSRMGIECFEAKGAFYLFPSIREFGMTSEEFAMQLLEEEKLAVVPGSAFGDCGEGFIRISYAYSIQELKEALARMERFITKLREKKA
jgi:aminotransferase